VATANSAGVVDIIVEAVVLVIRRPVTWFALMVIMILVRMFVAELTVLAFCLVIFVIVVFVNPIGFPQIAIIIIV